MAANWSGFVKLYFHDYFNQQNNESADTTEERSRQAAKRPQSSIIKTPALRYLPSYRLESKHPVNREICEKIIIRVVTEAVKEFHYSPKQAQLLTKYISEEIKTKVKMENYDRYKLICIVSIGEKFFQSYNSVCGFLWDECDGYLSYALDTPDFFIVATLYYLYYS